MLFKVLLASIILMNAYPTSCPVELYVGTCLDNDGNGHAEFCMEYDLHEPYTYIHYHDTEPGEHVVTTFEMGPSGEPDDILFRHDLVLK